MTGQTSNSSEQDSGEAEAKSGVHRRPRIPRELRAGLSGEDDKALRWFYRNGGSNATTRSTTAACLSIIESRRSVAIPCERCGGNVEKLEGGTGFVDSKTRRAPAPLRFAEEMLALLGDGNGSAELPPVAFGDQLCPDCDGRGWIVGARKPKKPKAKRTPPRTSPFRVTRPAVDGLPNVWPLTSHDAPAGYEMSARAHSDLALLGSISRRLKALLELPGGLAAVEALGAYYAPDGGTIAALWALVPAGRKMLRTNPLKLSATQLFQNLRQEQALKPSPTRAALFQAADRQSEELYAFACDAWRATGRTELTRGAKHEREVQSALAGHGEAEAAGDLEWAMAALSVLSAELKSESEGA